VVFLHHSKVRPHLFSLFKSKRRELCSFLGSLIGRPLGEFLSFTIVFGSRKVSLISLLNHTLPTITKVCYLAEQIENKAKYIFSIKMKKWQKTKKTKNSLWIEGLLCVVTTRRDGKAYFEHSPCNYESSNGTPYSLARREFLEMHRHCERAQLDGRLVTSSDSRFLCLCMSLVDRWD
jgi:hypothetical protein